MGDGLSIKKVAFYIWSDFAARPMLLCSVRPSVCLMHVTLVYSVETSKLIIRHFHRLVEPSF